MTKKRARVGGAVPSVPIAVKAEEESDGATRSCSSTTPGDSKRARPAGFVPVAPMAVKAEAARRMGMSKHATNSSSFSASESEVSAETGVTVST